MFDHIQRFLNQLFSLSDVVDKNLSELLGSGIKHKI